MENNTISKCTYSFGVSLAICSVLNAALVIAKESSKSVATGLQRITGHHWTTHVLVILVIFIALGLVLGPNYDKAESEKSPVRLIRTVVGGVVAGIVIILGFYLFVD